MAYIDDSYETLDDDLSFDSDLSESVFNNQRLATRYIRNDIKAIFYKIDIFTIFGFNFLRRLIAVKLLDISSKGVLVSTDKNLKINTKIILGLKFKTGKTFRIKALVVRKSAISKKIKIDSTLVSRFKFKFSKPFGNIGLVMHPLIISNYQYGIKFYNSHNELGDYLVETQKELKFK